MIEARGGLRMAARLHPPHPDAARTTFGVDALPHQFGADTGAGKAVCLV